jgi:polyhydroxybutyrate depolymerase
MWSDNNTASHRLNFLIQVEAMSSLKILLILLVATVLLQACKSSSSSSSSNDVSAPQDTDVVAAPGDYDNVMFIDGDQRSYHLHIPPSLDFSSKSILLLNLHGATGNEKNARTKTGFDQVSDQEKFIVAYPNSLNEQWNDGRNPTPAISAVNDTGFISALISKLTTALNIDTKRVFLSGFSNGAIFTQRFACEHADQITAIAAVSGPMAFDTYNQCHPSEPVSVLIFHGRDDPYVPWGGGDIPVFGGTVISVDDTYTYWSDVVNGCTGSPVSTSEPDRDPNDGTLVTRRAFDDVCTNQTSVILYDIEGGGHTWPGGNNPNLPGPGGPGLTSYDINASSIIWDFMNTHTK